MSPRWQPLDLGDPQANREINMLTASLDDSPPRWWYLSFCDTTRPKGTQFLGAAIVRAPNEPMAMDQAWRQGCNPGGQIAMWEIPDAAVPGPLLCNRLLTRAEVEAM